MNRNCNLCYDLKEIKGDLTVVTSNADYIIKKKELLLKINQLENENNRLNEVLEGLRKENFKLKREQFLSGFRSPDIKKRIKNLEEDRQYYQS